MKKLVAFCMGIAFAMGGGNSNLSYIPSHLDYQTAFRFLNKATFGATPKSVEELQKKGVVVWLNEQLNMRNRHQKYLKSMISVAKKYYPKQNAHSRRSFLKDNDVVFNKGIGSFDSPRYRLSAWYNIVLRTKAQLREKTAYVLSQIIVESDAAGIFGRRAEALANYFDILSDNAFSNYYKILEKISFSPGMGVYLTYNGNKKAYVKNGSVVLPDENYAREIMQLFTLGVYELNMDGTPKKDKNGNLIPVYTQKDVNELARVFTGWDLKRNAWYGRVTPGDGDFYHPMEFTAKYHDFGSKTILGKTIPANLSGEDDIKAAIKILTSHPNIAPYISKKLIKRFIKSNPSPEYVRRVAMVFKRTNGNLKEVIKAIFLDPEFWSDLKQNKWEKFKEPQIAYTQFLRAFNTKPLPFYHCFDKKLNNCVKVKGTFWINDSRWYLNQGPGLARTVFGFYDDDFIPQNKYFEENNLTAPELQIQTDIQMINFNNMLKEVSYNERRYLTSKIYTTKSGEKVKFKKVKQLFKNAKNIKGRTYFLFFYKKTDKLMPDFTDEYNVLEKAIDGDTNGDFKNLKDCREYQNEKAVMDLVNLLDKKLTGGTLSEEEKEALVEHSMCLYDKYSGLQKKEYLHDRVIVPLIRTIVGSEKFMRE